MAETEVKYLVFDIESVADGDLVARMRYPDEALPPRDAVQRYRAELLEQYNSDFIPYTFQIPVSVAVAKVSKSFQLLDLVTLDEPQYRPHQITEDFWRGWEAYRRPALVSFNGRSFDLPLLELAAFRYGVSAAGWFDLGARTYEQPRNRYNEAAHLDLHEVLTNYGASRFTGGLNLAASLLGKPGKMDVQGHMVQDLYDDQQLDVINDYCRCDVLDTYFVFLRVAVLRGQLTLAAEQQLIAAAKSWLESRRGQCTAFDRYLNHWGDWQRPQ